MFIGSTLGLPKLNGTNFLCWQEMITLHLEIQGLSLALTHPPDGVVLAMVDRKARYIILQTMDCQHQESVMMYKTAKDSMKRLAAAYADRSESHILRLLDSYLSIRKDPDMTMNKHVALLENKRLELISPGETISDKMPRVILLRSLPLEYDSVRENWENVQSHSELH